MLLIDGVKYEEWVPEGPRAEDEFEQVVKEHTQDIFGEQSIYVDRKQKLRSLSGIGSIPDGYVIVLGDAPHWHIVEMELSWHPPHEHIVPQLSKFTLGIKNPSTQNNLVKVIYEYISGDAFLIQKLKVETSYPDIHKFLSDLISKPPLLTVIIEKKREDLEAALDIFRRDYQIEIVEFRTFTREEVGLAVHAHLFEPLYKPAISIKPEFAPPQSPENSLEVTLQPSYIESYCIYIPAAKKHLFPVFNTTLELHTDIGLIETGFSIDSWGIWLSKGLAPWFKSHPQLKAGDKLLITEVDPKNKYRLEILK